MKKFCLLTVASFFSVVAFCQNSAGFTNHPNPAKRVPITTTAVRTKGTTPQIVASSAAAAKTTTPSVKQKTAQPAATFKATKPTTATY